jgi:hypothetical protein
MAALSDDNLTLLDMIKRTDPDSSIAKIVEAMTERNPILKDAVAKEGNLTTGHRHTIRSGLPTVGWRMINQGIDASKSKTIQVDETCGMLEGRSEVDCKLAKLNGNEAAFRASEDKAFVQSLNIEASNALFYSNTASDPEEILGFTPRFGSLSGDNADNIIDASAATLGNYTCTANEGNSMWFITWGDEDCHLIYPKGTKAGLSSEDLGKDYVEDADSKKFLAYRTHWEWNLGLSIRDWRNVIRICNIDLDQIAPTDDISYLINSMVYAYNHIYDLNRGRTVIYTSRAVRTIIDLQVMAKANVWFKPVEWHGKMISGFREIPIVTCDALSDNNEAVVT